METDLHRKQKRSEFLLFFCLFVLFRVPFKTIVLRIVPVLLWLNALKKTQTHTHTSNTTQIYGKIAIVCLRENCPIMKRKGKKSEANLLCICFFDMIRLYD